MALKRTNAAEVIDQPAQEEEVTTPVTDTAEQDDGSDAIDPTPAQPSTASTAVAPAQSTAVSTHSVSGNFLAKLREEGFEGLDIDWTSFPIVVLNQGEFETGDGNPLGVTSFTVRVQKSRKRYVFVTDVDKDHEDDKELAYTYDTAELNNPSSDLAKKVKEWEDAGVGHYVKEYLEAFVLVDDPNCRLNGRMVLLQIPPTSKGRFSGFLFEIGMTQNLMPHQILMRCSKGDKVKKAKNPFTPWQFDQVL